MGAGGIMGRGREGGLIWDRDDILRAVEALKPLGKGFTVFELGRRMMIRSVPKELNTDQSTVLEAIQVGFFPAAGGGEMVADAVDRCWGL
jgi:hypothetical protein